MGLFAGLICLDALPVGWGGLMVRDVGLCCFAGNLFRFDFGVVLDYVLQVVVWAGIGLYLNLYFKDYLVNEGFRFIV